MFNPALHFKKEGARFILLIIVVFSAAAATSQNLDYVYKLAGMDFYSRPNVVSTRAWGDGDVNSDNKVDYLDVQAINSGIKNIYADVNGDGVKGDSNDLEILQKYINGQIPHLPGDWNELNRAEKISWLDKRVKYNILHETSLPPVDGINPQCGNYTMEKFIKFGGIENFSNFDGFDYNYDGKKEGYDYYKNYVQNGIENIPIYFAGLNLKNGEAHFWPAIFVGSENPEEKDNPLDFNQWYIFDYGNAGGQIKPGDEGLNENSPVRFEWWGWGPDIFGNFEHNLWGGTSFYLNNGIASYKDSEVSSYILRENPHQLYVKGEDEEIKVEREFSEPDLSTSKYGMPKVESNAEFNKPIVKQISSEFTPFNKNHPEYGVMEQKFKAEINIGRWNGNNLESLVDTMKRRFIVDDTTAPVVVAPKDTLVGKNSSIGPEVTGIPIQSDASPYELNNWYEDRELSNDGSFKKIERTFYSEDVRGNVGEAKQIITVDLLNGIEELKKEGKEIDIDILGNPVSRNTRFRISTKDYLEHGEIYIYNMLGQVIERKVIDNLLPNEEREIPYSCFGLLTHGTYLLQFSGNGAVSTELIQR